MYRQLLRVPARLFYEQPKRRRLGDSSTPCHAIRSSEKSIFGGLVLFSIRALSAANRLSVKRETYTSIQFAYRQKAPSLRSRMWLRLNVIRFLISSTALVAVAADPADAKGIDTVRDKVSQYELLILRYTSDAIKLSSDREITTRYRNIDAKEQSCAVLADLLGVGPDAIAHAVHLKPEQDSKSADEFMLYALSLRSYVRAARAILQDDEFTWRYRWNLNCSGVYNSEKLFLIKDDPPFSVSISEDGLTLRVIGNIKSGLFDAIAKRLAIHRRIRVVELGSLGGLTYEGLKIGRLLRQRNIVTVVANNCYSSCALIFLGGEHRIVPAPYWSLGFHRASSEGTALWDGDEVYEKIRVYVDEMIGDGPGLVNSSLKPIGLDFYRPSRQEMCDREIATSVEGVCGENASSVIGSTLE